MTDDNDSTLEELKIDRQLKPVGASVTMTQNSGFLSKLEKGFWSFLALAIVAGSFTVANNLYQLNLTVAQGVKNDAAQAARLDDHEVRLRQVERDVSTIEGKVFRGVKGYGEQTSAP